MKTSDYLADALQAQGVTHVFELVGGMTTHLIDSLLGRGRVKLVSVHHEQAAAFAAEGFARMSGIPGVALATSGPGATNLLTGIGSCYFDSTPAVFLTGQVNRHEQKGSRALRQLGFQETDIVAMATPVTKWAYLVQTPEEVPEVIDRAFRIASSGRPGPVLIDLPMDVQRAELPSSIDLPVPPLREPAPLPLDFESLHDHLGRSERPLILAGGGVRSAHAVDPFREFVDACGIPVVHSLMGVDLLPYEHPLRVGMIGSYGNRWANLALARSDVLIVLGSRLDVRQTGSEVAAFSQGKVIYHVDCDTSEMNNRVKGCRAIHSELAPFLRAAATRVRSSRGMGLNRPTWRAEIQGARNKWPDSNELRDRPGINPNVFMHELSRVSREASAFVVDVGQHQMWAAQSLELASTQRFLTSGGMGAMGFALPAALGVAMASPERPVVVIAGDGGFQLNLQELQTVVRNRLPLKIVVVNNQCHGMVRQFQQSYFGERYQSTLWGYSSPNFAAVAESFGIKGLTLEDPAQVSRALSALWSDPGQPFLLDARVDTFANAYPKIVFGYPISEMEPFSTPRDMEGT